MQSSSMPRTWLAVVALVVTGVTSAALAPPGSAIVPPTDCGRVTVEGKRYNIKADQLRCSRARPYARRYLATGDRPSGYRCRKFGRETKLKFRCTRGIKVFFAIRR